MSVPVTVVKGYEAPSFVGDGTLCFAISYSGDTEETLEAAQAAAGAGARMVVLSSGGALADLAAVVGRARTSRCPTSRCRVPASASVSIPPLIVLERVGLFPGATQYVADAVDQLAPPARQAHRRRRPGPARSPARSAARSRSPTAATPSARWRPTASSARSTRTPRRRPSGPPLPEMCHNEICGWGQHGDVTRQVMTVVRFRHDFEHPQVTRRFDLTFDVIDEVVHAVLDVEAEGEGALAQLFDLVIQGDFVSLHLAAEAGVDPGPIPVLARPESGAGPLTLPLPWPAGLIRVLPAAASPRIAHPRTACRPSARPHGGTR